MNTYHACFLMKFYLDFVNCLVNDGGGGAAKKPINHSNLKIACLKNEITTHISGWIRELAWLLIPEVWSEEGQFNVANVHCTDVNQGLRK